MMKRTILGLCCLFFFLQVCEAQEIESKTLGSEHLIVHFFGDEKFAKDVLRNAEIYYQDIALDLGYPRYSEFWTWDKRVHIFIYPDHASYIKVTAQPSWTHGVADYTNKQIASYVWSQGFIESLLPHEMAHLIFRDFVGFKGEIPLWLDEGVAQWAEKPKRAPMKQLAKQLYESDQLITLEDMMKLDIRGFQEKDRVYIRPNRRKDGSEGVLLISGDNYINTYYVQAVSVVGFLIEKYGSDSFAHFCRQLRDGKSLEEALRFAYGVHVQSLNELEEKWREYLRDLE